MNIQQINQAIKSPEYSFLTENEHLGNNVILLGLGGSHAYGTAIPESDLDIRGVALNKKEEILTNQNFEQFTNDETDTVIYSFNKIISLLSNCNPNVIELLGLKPEHYLYLSPIGQELLDNKELFLSQLAAKSFGGYANQQLYRLSHKAAHSLELQELEKHVHKVMKSMIEGFSSKYAQFPEDSLNIYLDTATSDNSILGQEQYLDISLKHYPLRDYCGMMNELNNTLKQYEKYGTRNKKAAEHGKIAKHSMHLIRLLLMAKDILAEGKIVTYREEDLLQDIRKGKYLDGNNQPTKEFFQLVQHYENELDKAKKITTLPPKPDYKKINEFLADINYRIVTDSV